MHHGLRRSVLPQYNLPGSPQSALACQQGRPIRTPKCQASAVRSATPSAIVSGADLADWLEASQVCGFPCLWLNFNPVMSCWPLDAAFYWVCC